MVKGWPVRLATAEELAAVQLLSSSKKLNQAKVKVGAYYIELEKPSKSIWKPIIKAEKAPVGRVTEADGTLVGFIVGDYFVKAADENIEIDEARVYKRGQLHFLALMRNGKLQGVQLLKVPARSDKRDWPEHLICVPYPCESIAN